MEDWSAQMGVVERGHSATIWYATAGLSMDVVDGWSVMMAVAEAVGSAAG